MNTLALRDGGPIGTIAAVLSSALRSITARHLRIALVFGGVFWLVTMLVEWRYVSRFRGWRGAAVDFVDLELASLWLLLAVAIADAAVAHGAGRRTAYVMAALAGIAVSQIFSGTVIEALDNAIIGPTLPLNESATLVTMRIYVTTHWLLFVGTGVFLYAQWRAAHRMQEHLRAAELDRVRKSRLALESRLQALQARVEPEFLFRTLSHVRDLYDRDVVLGSPARASKMLDDLIAYLRAAMPHVRDTSSTVAQEVELARAYLDIAQLRMDGRLGVDIAAAEDIADARMPPMMVLPLIDDALEACSHENDARPTISIDVRARGDRLQASVIRSPGGSTNTEATSLANIRERLNGLYGASASLEVTEVKAGCVEARLELPLEFVRAMTSEEAHSAFPRERGAEPM